LVFWNNFHVDHFDWITTEFGLKFKYISEFEFELNSNGILEFDLIRSLIMMFRVQKKCLNIRDVT
jgi:hypothetical protein